VLAPLSVAAAKRSILNGLETTLAAGLSIEAYEMYGVSTTGDCLEGVQSFVEKRSPGSPGRDRWSGLTRSTIMYPQ